MKAGKLSESVLKRSVLRQLHTEDAWTKPAVGQDCAVVKADSGGFDAYAVSTMPLAAEFVEAPVYNAVNNILCAGAEPTGILVNLLLPTSASEQRMRDMMGRINRVCKRESLQVLGGHTEVVRSVTEPVLTVTAAGRTGNVPVSGSGAKPGMDVVMTKWAGLLGTAVLAREQEPRLRTRYAKPFIDRAAQFSEYMSIRSEAAVAVQSGAAAMHDLTEGGVYGALWELAQCSGVGLEIDLKKIPIRQETVEVCEFFNLNPYKLLSTGSLLIAAEDGSALVHAITETGGSAAVIGRTTDSNDRVLLCEDERRFLETAQTDELWKIKRHSEI